MKKPHNLSITQKLVRGVRRLGREGGDTLAYINRTKKMSLASIDYADYWHIRGLHAFQPRFQIFADAIDSGATVLDIGCGDGSLLEYLAGTRGIRGYGVDVSEEAVRLAKTRGVDATVANILHWDLEQKYDYIILSEVLEHLINPERVIVKVRDHFRQRLLISIPNIGYYRHRLRLMFGRFPVQWEWHPAEHLRYWTVTDFVEWLSELGLQVVSLQASNGLPLLFRYFPNLFGDQIVFIANIYSKEE